jgi:hypothetical protein
MTPEPECKAGDLVTVVGYEQPCVVERVFYLEDIERYSYAIVCPDGLIRPVNGTYVQLHKRSEDIRKDKIDGVIDG